MAITLSDTTSLLQASTADRQTIRPKEAVASGKQPSEAEADDLDGNPEWPMLVCGDFQAWQPNHTPPVPPSHFRDPAHLAYPLAWFATSCAWDECLWETLEAALPEQPGGIRPSYLIECTDEGDLILYHTCFKNGNSSGWRLVGRPRRRWETKAAHAVDHALAQGYLLDPARNGRLNKWGCWKYPID